LVCDPIELDAAVLVWVDAVVWVTSSVCVVAVAAAVLVWVDAIVWVTSSVCVAAVAAGISPSELDRR